MIGCSAKAWDTRQALRKRTHSDAFWASATSDESDLMLVRRKDAVFTLKIPYDEI
jgi:hypothetical protein